MGGIEKSDPRITVWHQEACRVMTKDDPRGQIHFLMNDYDADQIYMIRLCGADLPLPYPAE